MGSLLTNSIMGTGFLEPVVFAGAMFYIAYRIASIDSKTNPQIFVQYVAAGSFTLFAIGILIFALDKFHDQYVSGGYQPQIQQQQFPHPKPNPAK